MLPIDFFIIFSSNLPALLVEFIPRQSQSGMELMLMAATFGIFLTPKNKRRTLWQRAKKWLQRLLTRPTAALGDDYQFYERLIYGVILMILFFVFILTTNFSILTYLAIMGALAVGLLSYAIYSAVAEAKKRDERLKRKADAAAEAQRKEAMRKEAEDFFAQNAQRPEVKTLPNGVQYQVLNPGNASQSSSNETAVSFSYGKTPEQGYYEKRNFSEVIAPQQHQELVAAMPQNVGAKYRFYIPPAAAAKYYQKKETYKLGYSTEPIYQLFIDVEILTR